jgi:hypothetical protein
VESTNFEVGKTMQTRILGRQQHTWKDNITIKLILRKYAVM